MNITPPNQFNRPSVSRELGDDKMEQIRELLFGEYERQNEVRFAELEARVKELELSLHQRLDALQARLDDLSATVADGHKSAFDELARGLNELGERIRFGR